jgi:predicted nucleic acid-binding protein
VARSFLDTNVLLYSDDAYDARKNTIAVELIAALRARQEAVVSIQVLQEYFVNAVGKLKVDAIIARRRVELFGRFAVVVPTVDIVLAAIDLQRLHTISFWDAMIVQAASAGGCQELLSEDMQAGRTIAGVRIVNPFPRE